MECVFYFSFLLAFQYFEIFIVAFRIIIRFKEPVFVWYYYFTVTLNLIRGKFKFNKYVINYITIKRIVKNTNFHLFGFFFRFGIKQHRNANLIYYCIINLALCHVNFILNKNFKFYSNI